MIYLPELAGGQNIRRASILYMRYLIPLARGARRSLCVRRRTVCVYVTRTSHLVVPARP